MIPKITPFPQDHQFTCCLHQWGSYYHGSKQSHHWAEGCHGWIYSTGLQLEKKLRTSHRWQQQNGLGLGNWLYPLIQKTAASVGQWLWSIRGFQGDRLRSHATFTSLLEVKWRPASQQSITKPWFLLYCLKGCELLEASRHVHQLTRQSSNQFSRRAE